MPNKNSTPHLRTTMIILMGLLQASCARYLPDYEIKGLRVNADEINVGSAGKPNYKVAWHVELLTFNNGKTIEINELVDEDGFSITHIPVMFTAYVNNYNLQGCPTKSTENVRVYKKPSGLVLKTWRYLPISNDPISSFSNVFILDANSPPSCIPEKIVVDYDSRQSVVFTPSTIDEFDETNNSISIDILDYPTQKVWSKKKPDSDEI